MVLCLLGSYKANNSERRLAVQSATTACSQTELGRYHFCYYCFLIFAASQSLVMKNKESNTRLAKIVLPFTYLSSDSDPQFSSNYKWLPNFFVRSKENGISMKKYNNYDWRIEKINKISYYINRPSSFEIQDWISYFGATRTVWLTLLSSIFWSNFLFPIKLREIK